MIEEDAVVVRVESDRVWIETQRKSTCGQCAAKSGCGTAVLSKVLGQKRSQIPVLKTLPVKVGDRVVIGIKENSLLRGSFAVYAFPLLAMLLFGMLGETVNQHVFSKSNDSMAIAGAVLGLIAGALWMRLFATRIRRDSNYQPSLLSCLLYTSDAADE